MCALLGFEGCRTIPGPKERSIEELYMEALKAKPEANLGMDHPQIPPSTMPEYLPVPMTVPGPIAPIPMELETLPVEMIGPSTPASTQGVAPPSVPGTVNPISHQQSSGTPGGVIPASTTAEKPVNDIFTETVCVKRSSRWPPRRGSRSCWTTPLVVM
ncbi:MAG: hypothetical protein DWH91_03255 [Planctomycetota bacterium]|nr:MAG: hypothetical protein DWH91_03255 [Planctomycetota bacterium]